jgi:thioredoxin reductase (NADPH)
VAPHTIHVVGGSWSGRAYEIRDALERCAIPHSFCLAESDRGRELLEQTDGGTPLPLMILPNGMVLENPSDSEIAYAAGAAVQPGQSEFDLVIVGSGPAGRPVGGGLRGVGGARNSRRRQGRHRRAGHTR